uniref:Ubiquitin-like domain-containing protein n=1 Tax=Kalanchoe fedtschenkoi TaxID=63787 RepID=A0A7N0UWM4_KALFE
MTNQSGIDGGEDEVEVTVKRIGPSPPARVKVPALIKVAELRKLIGSSGKGPTENLRLVLRGNVLNDREDGEDVLLRLKHGDTIIAAVKPKSPAKHIRADYDEDDDDLIFRIPQLTSKWKRKLYSFLRKKLKIPDIILIAIFSISLKTWLMIVTWFIMAPIAHRWDLGPVYILGTGFAIIFLNLGKRQSGDVSAYSIFNEDFRELPGTFNADRIDRDMRAGQF